MAVSAIRDFLDENEMDVRLAVLDRSTVEVDGELFGSVEKYVNDNLNTTLYDSDDSDKCCGAVSPKPQKRRLFDGFGMRSEKASAKAISSPPMANKFDMAEYCAADIAFDRLDESFSEALLRLIDERGLTDSQVYKRANVDRRLFSKIRSNREYRPSKTTALAFAIALELDIDQTGSLLEKAGFTLSNSIKFDVIVRYFIEMRNYDIYTINETLFAFDQSLIGY